MSAQTRPGFIVVGIILAVLLLAGIFWVRHEPASLPVAKLIDQLQNG